MTTNITATFKTRAEAETCLYQLDMLGISSDQVSLLTTETSHKKNSFNITEATKAPEGATAGGVSGGLVGSVLGAFATAGALAIPGLNVVVGGWLIGALTGLGAGALTGGLLGGLIGAGIPEHEAKLYENQLKEGAILIAVEAKSADQEEKIRDVMKHNNAQNVAA